MLRIEEEHHMAHCSTCCPAAGWGMCLEHSLTASPVFCLPCQAGEHTHNVQETTPDWDPTWHYLANQWPNGLGSLYLSVVLEMPLVPGKTVGLLAHVSSGAVQATAALLHFQWQRWTLLSSTAPCCQDQRRMLLWLFCCHNKSYATQQRNFWIFTASFSLIHLLVFGTLHSTCGWKRQYKYKQLFL